jgi:hypothetical protein
VTAGYSYIMTDSDIFDEHLLQARDVCRNCFSLVRVERIDPTRGGVAREFESHYERNRQTTTVDYGASRPCERAERRVLRVRRRGATGARLVGG